MKSEPKRRGRPANDPPTAKLASLGLRVPPALKDALDEKARTNGHSQSQEAVRLIQLALHVEATRLEIDRLHAEAQAERSAAKLKAIREAGLQLVREAGGGVTVNVSADLLLDEAEGIIRSGWIADEAAVKSPTEVAIERAIERASERIIEGVVARLAEKAP